MKFRNPVLLVTILLAGGCVAGSEPRATAAQQAYCRQRADEIYNRQNPGEVYRTDMYVSSQRDAPFAGNGSVGDPMAALGARYSRDKILDACLRNAANPPARKP